MRLRAALTFGCAAILSAISRRSLVCVPGRYPHARLVAMRPREPHRRRDGRGVPASTYAKLGRVRECDGLVLVAKEDVGVREDGQQWLGKELRHEWGGQVEGEELVRWGGGAGRRERSAPRPGVWAGPTEDGLPARDR